MVNIYWLFIDLTFDEVINHLTFDQKQLKSFCRNDFDEVIINKVSNPLKIVRMILWFTMAK